MSDVSGSNEAAVTTPAVFEKTVPGVPGAVTVMVNWTLAPFASDAAVQVTVPPDSLQPADADTNVTAPGNVSVTVTLLAASGPLFVTVNVYVRFDDTVRSTRCGDLAIERSAVDAAAATPTTLRMRWPNESAMTRLPAGSTATPWGLFNRALVAAIPSPLNPPVPVPATVLMLPDVSTLRTRSFPASTIKRLPAGSIAMPVGKLKSALVAAIPSPLNPSVPVPATVLMLPDVSTLRTRLLFVSLKKRLPAESTATPMEN